MTGYYKKPAETGKCYPCKSCGKTPTAGQDRYYEKITGPDGSEVWIGCVDFECFKKQGGSSEQAQAKKGMFQSTKFKLESVDSIKDIAFGLIDKFEEKYKASTTPEKLSMDDRAIMFESLFRTVSQNFKP